MGYRSLRGIDGHGGAFDKARRVRARARFETDKHLIVHVRPEHRPGEEPEPERGGAKPDEPHPHD